MTDCHFTTKSMEEFSEHMKNVHSLVKQSKPAIKELNRIPCSIPGCSKTFASVLATFFSSLIYRRKLYKLILLLFTIMRNIVVSIVEKSILNNLR